MARNPFEYYDGCAGPTVNTDIVPTGFTSCDDVIYTQPTLVLQEYPVTVPDVAPPPLCNGLAFGGATRSFGGIISGTIDVSIGGSACAPGVTVNLNLEAPCIAFTTIGGAFINTGTVSLVIGVDRDTCELTYNLDITLPPLGGAGTATGVLVTVVTDVFMNGLDLMQTKKVLRVLTIDQFLSSTVVIAGTDCTNV